MKKLISAFLVVVLLITSTTATVFARENDEQNHSHTEDYIDIGSKKEVVIEVNSHEEAINYPRNHNYRYVFIISEDNPIATKAICYNCGKPNMESAKAEYDGEIIVRKCPIQVYGHNDHMYTYELWEIERCTACGYKAQYKHLSDRYESVCYNGAGTYEVRKGWTQQAGYDIHQSYDYWKTGSMK